MPICLPSFAGTTAPASSVVFNEFSVDFDGTDDFVSTSPFDLTTNKTVSFWIKFDAINSGGVYLFGKGSPANYYPYVTGDGKTLYLYSGGIGILSLGETHKLTAGSWIHLAITGDGTTARCYKNGVERATGTDRTPTGIDRFAGDSAGGTRFLNGLMDEVAVWDAELSAADITSIYNSGVPNDLSEASSYDTDRTSNLVHWWRMGENDGGTGTTITDQGSGSNNGTLTNGPTFSTDVPS